MKITRVLSLVLALIMMMSLCVFAEDAEDTEGVEEVIDWSDFEDDEEEDITVTYEWPTETLAGIPVFDATSYEVWTADGCTDIYLPAGSEANFAAYAKQLTDIGASLYVESDEITVLAMGETEVHLLPDAEQPVISFLYEAAYDYEEDLNLYPELADYPIPENGRVVYIDGSYLYGDDESADMESIYLTLRCASISDALAYLEQLTMAGWTAVEEPVPENGMLFCSYTKGDRLVLVDYYWSSSDYFVYFGMDE